MKRKLSTCFTFVVFLFLLSLLSACMGEKHVYEGTLTTQVVKSGSGNIVGSGDDKVAVTMSKSGDYATLSFKTITDGQIKSELDYCTVSLMKLGDSWEEKDSKKCDVEGTEMVILKGKVNVNETEKTMLFDIEAVRYGTGSSNKYSFTGKEK